MDHIPSQSISKPVLLATPFFLIVLAVLHASSEVSYMFVLNFINNVAGSADLTFLPSTKPEVSHEDFTRDSIMGQYGINLQAQTLAGEYKIPLINVSEIEHWAKDQPIIRDVSPRWLMPSQVGKTDTILMVMDTARQIKMGVGQGINLQPMPATQVAVEQTFMNQMDLQLGDILPISLKPSDILSGLKLFQKITQASSDQQYDLDSVTSQDPKQLGRQLYRSFDFGNTGLTQEVFANTFALLYNQKTTVEYSVRQTFYPSGLYPSTLHNVIIMEKDAFVKLITTWVVQSLIDINDRRDIIDVKKYLPDQYKFLWPTNKQQAQLYAPQISEQVNQTLTDYSLIMVARLQNREQVYYPYGGQMFNKFAQTLQQIPPRTQVIALYPFYKDSLAIKFFFDSVIQIFEFVTCILFYYTISLIMKQIYEQKEIQVGIWRTLGAGGLPKKVSESPHQIQMNENSLRNSDKSNLLGAKYSKSPEIKEKIRFAKNLLFKVGYVQYWFIAVAVSIVLYCLLKLLIYFIVAKKLHFDMIMQPIGLPFLLFFIIFAFIQWVSISHIRQILTNPLSETIKPVKRTFDVVKVRVIHIATFGISVQILMVAVMLIYYGVVSYYWIPFAVLDKDADLQVVLLNTIFIFMIFGAIMLISILQSKIQIGILWLLFRFNKKMKSMKLALLKNIKAKQYKNIKVTIIISLIFAFVLFFTAGISIQIKIIQSFIKRSLGAELVFENYEQKTFNTSLINDYLDQQDQIRYSWLSRDLSRKDFHLSLISHISGEQISPQFQVLSPPYLNTTFIEYYYPQDYLTPEAQKSYWTLPNGIHDGFNSIYTGIGGRQSVGRFDPQDTIKQVDPYKINQINPDIPDYIDQQKIIIAPQEQVINMVISASLKKQLGVEVGDYYKMKVSNYQTRRQYYMRSRVVHSFKAGPGFDILHDQAFISQEQADYIYRILGISENQFHQNQKLFITGSEGALKRVGNKILSLSPDHTQMFQVGFVSQSFSLLANSLDAYVIGITAIMSCLAVLFLFLYTLGKCQEEAEMYKMLRAIGLSCFDIRLMVFTEIIVRLFVAIMNGILLGIVLSIGFSLQIQEFLMIKTPLVNPSIVLIIAALLLIIFGITIIRATAYLQKRTVANTASK